MVKPKLGDVIRRDIKKNKYLYLLVTPVILFYIIFHYVPMYGAVIAFKNFNPAKGILGSSWVGFKHFTDFFTDYYFVRILRNTLTISLSSIIFGFPAPIILALLINELKSRKFVRITQTITYLPHFISMVVVAGMIKELTASNGIINDITAFFGAERVTMLTRKDMFVPLFVISGIWQEVGWGSIVYIAALSGIDPSLYQAAMIDGAGRGRQLLHITLPGILPTIVTLFILRMGAVLNVGFEKIILLYNPATIETADVISSFVYRKGIGDANYSYATAVGLFNSVINFLMLILSNKLSKKFSETSLW